MMLAWFTNIMAKTIAQKYIQCGTGGQCLGGKIDTTMFALNLAIALWP